MTEYIACPACRTRLILARGVPPLNFFPDPAGKVTAEHLASGAWKARFLARNEEPVIPEKRYAVHECAEQKHVQRGHQPAPQDELARARQKRRARGRKTRTR